VVFTLVGFLLFLAAYHHDPNQAQGIDGYSRPVAATYGPWLLGVVALA